MGLLDMINARQDHSAGSYERKQGSRRCKADRPVVPVEKLPAEARAKADERI